MISEVYNMDCMEHMLTLSTNSINLAIPDPPYFVGPNKRKFYGNSINKLNIRRKDYPVTHNWSIPDDKYFDLLFNVSVHQIIWGANYYPTLQEPFKSPRRHEYDDFIAKNPKGWIIYDTHAGSQGLRISCYELGYDFIGCEIEKVHFDAGNKRFEQFKQQQKLFI